MSRAGFTLIELVAVLFLMALLAAVVSVAGGGRLRDVRMDELLATLRARDLELRAECEARGIPGELVLDVDAEEIESRTLQGSEGTPLGRLRLPRGIDVEEVWIHGDAAGSRRSGRGRVPYTRDGTSATYAVTLGRGPGERRTLVWAGLTGAPFEVDGFHELQLIQETLSRRDAR